jgi:hypothetical protein
MKYSIKLLVLMFIMLAVLVKSADAQDEITFRRYIISSGINGLFYGVAIDVIAELDGGAAAGVAVISSGVASLIPILSNPSRSITQNSLMLSGHGKVIGWAHGFAFSTILLGEDAWDENQKFTIGLGAITSITLGMVGNSLGKTRSWTEGQAALYRHYGWMGPLTGVSIMASFSDEPRLYAAADLLFGAGGYLLADKVYNWNNFTRGDVRAAQVLSVLTGGLGLGIVADIADQGDPGRASVLIPAIGVLTGSLAGQLLLKNARLTPKQGLQSAYAATGGAILGLGIALLTESEKLTPYYVIPYITGLGAYSYALGKMRKNNLMQGFIPDNKKNNWVLALMPQNLFLNSKMQAKNFYVNGRLVGMQPLFAASLTF